MNETTSHRLLANGLPQPPIPQRLRELLKDYPGHLVRIQEDLNDLLLNHAKSIPLFEQAIWALEGQTSAFIREAQAELEAAQEVGDADEIARAEVKEELMFSARSVNDGLKGLHELWSYFEENKDSFK
ncbi:hypothetical protein [Lysobacter hankyongensis]|uniref:Uncharacterized protein n=1 Tax=Lysobacter hankyongensis TaxID=1176535 RepID=A0ABP9BLK1_9GAMM